ncbi:hypothetical protein PENTCL1PPCAC_14322, partial [Pristionchus entomophagus]
PWIAVGVTALSVLAVNYAYIDHKLRGPAWKRLFYLIASMIKNIPVVIKPAITAELEGAQWSITTMIHKGDSSKDWLTELPDNGLDRLNILTIMVKYSKRENNGTLKREKPAYLQGAVSGAVLNRELNSEESKLTKAVFGFSAYANPLWPAIFPEIRRMEAEVVEMTKTMLHGGEEVCGTMTAGGSMSILQAYLAHSNRAYATGVMFPEMILPSSVHVAFYKAAEMFRIKVVEIKVADTQFVVDPSRVEVASNGNTCMMVGSVPNYPYGTCDDIKALGEIAINTGVSLHVDACCGGFLIPFFDQKDNIPEFDFRVPGVYTISADTHKYGLAPKGSSVILYKDKETREFGVYKDVDWSGGIYCSPTIEGSRIGSAIAVTWASLLFNGKANLEESATLVRRVIRELRDRITQLDGMEMMGHGDVCIVAWNNYKLNDLLEKEGYFLSSLQFPTGMFLVQCPSHGDPLASYFDGLIDAMERRIQQLLKNPGLNTGGAQYMYGASVQLPDRRLIASLAEI